MERLGFIVFPPPRQPMPKAMSIPGSGTSVSNYLLLKDLGIFTHLEVNFLRSK